MKKILTTGHGIVIGIPTLGRPLTLDWALAFKGLNPPINYNTSFQIVRSKEIADARNEIAKYAIQSDSKYLFFLGDDVEVPPHVLRSLIFHMEQRNDIGVIGGIYCAKSDPSFPLVFQGNGRGSYWDWKIGEVFPCTGLGMDCTLIRVDLLKQLSDPYFKTIDEDKFLDGINAAESWTEDLYFCKKVLEETNYEIYADGGAICRHWDVYNNKFYTLPPGSLPYRQKLKTDNLKQCLTIGETSHLDFGDYEVTTFGTPTADYRGLPHLLPFDANVFDWVVSADNGLDFYKYYQEYLRVLKVGGKLSMAFTNRFISRERIRKYFDPKFQPHINGNFVELIKYGEFDSKDNG